MASGVQGMTTIVLPGREQFSTANHDPSVKTVGSAYVLAINEIMLRPAGQ